MLGRVGENNSDAGQGIGESDVESLLSGSFMSGSLYHGDILAQKNHVFTK